MSLHNKLSVIFFMAFHLLTVIITTNVSAQNTDTLCPSTLLVAILQDDHEMVEFLLEHGIDPNTSLENCRFRITEGKFKLQVNNEGREGDYINAFEIGWPIYSLNYSSNPWLDFIGEIRRLSWNNLSLLHVAALYHLHIHDAFGQPPFVYRSLIDYGANPGITDRFERTPESIMASKKRYSHLRP